MAQRDHVARALGGLDAGHTGHGQHIALLDLAVGDGRGGLRLHEDLASGDGAAVRGVLGRDVDHARPSHGIEVGEGEIAHLCGHTSDFARGPTRHQRPEQD